MSVENLLDIAHKCIDILKEASTIVEGQELNNFIEKIKNAIKDVTENNKIKVAVYGSFSDGKSSIIAGILKRADIKIAPEPTTDKIEVYESENFILIDTPGLMSENLMHDEITRKFISEADVVLFVTEAINPLKDSHLDFIKWLLKDLKKINSTIFVVNKIDETDVDLYDDKDFERVCNIKKRVVRQILSKILEENENIDIVCVSANPWNQGLSYWLDNYEEYFKISRLNLLVNAINKLAQKQGKRLKFEKLKSTIRDVYVNLNALLNKQIEEIEQLIKFLELELQELKETLPEITQKLKEAIVKASEEMDNLHKEIYLELVRCENINCFANIINMHIGKDGRKLKQKINLILRRNFMEVEELSSEVFSNIKSNYELFLKISQSVSSTQETIMKLNIANMTIKSLGYLNKIEDMKKLQELITKFPLPSKISDIVISKLPIATKTLPWIPIIGNFVEIGIKVYEKKKIQEAKDQVLKYLDDILNKCKEELLEASGYSIKFMDYIKDRETELQNLINRRKTIKNLKEVLNQCEEVLND